MNTVLVSALSQALLAMLDGETAKRVIDAGLDIIEDAVRDSANPLDDALLLPLCAKIRDNLEIPEYES